VEKVTAAHFPLLAEGKYFPQETSYFRCTATAICMRLLHLDLTFWSVFSATPRCTDTYGNTCRLHDYINNNESTRILTSVVICHTYRRLCSFALDFVYCRLKFVCHSLQYFIFCLYLHTLFRKLSTDMLRIRTSLSEV
jgi:hypothetical protein